MSVESKQGRPWAYWVALTLAFLGALAACGGSLVFMVEQTQMASPGGIWPLPGLVLLEWALLGISGFLSAYFARKSSPVYWRRVAWLTVGALAPLVVLGAFSIGTFVFFSLLFFLGSAIFGAIHREEGLFDHLAQLLLGAVCNLGLLLLFIVLNNFSS